MNEEFESCNFCPRPKNILFVVTNTDRFNENHKTGVWLEEFAVPYMVLLDEGYSITVASPKGGEAPIDPASCKNELQDAIRALGDTKALNAVDFTTFDALILPGGHGPMFDLSKDETLAIIINDFQKSNKLIAAICHGPAGLLSAKTNGIPFVNGRKLTCYTNEEEVFSKKENLIPYFLEDALKDAGALFVQGSIGEVNVVEDNNLITAQNYQSVKAFTNAVVKYLSHI